MRSYSHLNTASAIVAGYDGSTPLAQWLKEYFRSNKKFGSTDRKQISQLCYSYYRLGRSFENYAMEEKMLIALFLTLNISNRMLEELKPAWNEAAGNSIEKKIAMLPAETELEHLFPFKEEMSLEIDKEKFSRSFLIQPNLYLRLRPGRQQEVIEKLKTAGIEFQLLGTDAVALQNQTKANETIVMDEEAVVQDINSQKVVALADRFLSRDKPIRIWDCCAASGGKAIQLMDKFPAARLTVSDVRQSIMINLQNRFKRAGIQNYDQFVFDIAAKEFSTQKRFDLVVCDAPCSGSGTWSRTPEQLHFFKKEKIDYYAELQKKIVLNAGKTVKEGGFFLYITCSVFKKENEEVASFIHQNLPLKLESMQYFKGYEQRADSLFAALFSFSIK